MLARFSDLLADAVSRRAAVGAFTCYNLEQAAGVLRAADARRAGVVVLVSEKSFAGADGPLLLSALVAAAEQSGARACVQLDHVSDFALIESAFALGAGAVLADGCSARGRLREQLREPDQHQAAPLAVPPSGRVALPRVRLQ